VKKNIALLSLIFLPLSLLLLSCTSTTGTSTGTLTGTVQLEGQSDHSGIVIGIYELAELDPDIVEANQKWPHIGVIINQHTEFDHRFGTLIKTGETDASGSFEIADIPTGVYNIVTIKDGFGFRYVYEVQLNEGNNTIPNLKDDLTLYPETQVTSNISSPTTWQTNHHYIIGQDIIIDDELTIEPGAVIRLNEGVKMSVYGALTAVGEADNFIWFTSNDSINSFSIFRFPSSVSLFEYKMIELDGNLNKDMSFCKFDHASTGLLNYVNGFEISDCVFRESQCGFKAEDVDSTFCRNLLCEEISNESYGGIYFDHVNVGIIEKNIVFNCENGIRIKNESNPEISNNEISFCNIGLNDSYHCLANIFHNEIRECDIGIQKANYSPNIFYNNIFNCQQGIISLWASPILHYNNLNCFQYNIKIDPKNHGDLYDVNAENNYYYTVDLEIIKEKAYDRNDIHPGSPYYNYTGIILYLESFLTQEYPYAGIQDE